MKFLNLEEFPREIANHLDTYRSEHPPLDRCQINLGLDEQKILRVGVECPCEVAEAAWTQRHALVAYLHSKNYKGEIIFTVLGQRIGSVAISRVNAQALVRLAAKNSLRFPQS